MPEAGAAPIFVVGCHRSGTTMLRLILDSHPRISCGPETRFLADFEQITGSQWHRLQLYGFSAEDWHRRIGDFFGGAMRDYAESKGKQRWADKTPMYALHMDFLAKLFPDAQFVHVIRDGRDVVASHRARVGYKGAVGAVAKWPRYIRTARASGARLAAGHYHEVRYEELVGDTESTLRSLMDFLGEQWDPALLAHEEQPHDVPEAHRARAAARRAAAGSDGSVYASRVGSHERELDPLLRALGTGPFRATLRELGYR